MWRVLAGIMHLGNVEFTDDPATGLASITNPAVAAYAGEYLGAPTLDVKLVRVSSARCCLCKSRLCGGYQVCASVCGESVPRRS